MLCCIQHGLGFQRELLAHTNQGELSTHMSDYTARNTTPTLSILRVFYLCIAATIPEDHKKFTIIRNCVHSIDAHVDSCAAQLRPLAISQHIDFFSTNIVQYILTLAFNFSLSRHISTHRFSFQHILRAALVMNPASTFPKDNQSSSSKDDLASWWRSLGDLCERSLSDSKESVVTDAPASASKCVSWEVVVASVIRGALYTMNSSTNWLASSGKRL